PGPPTHARTHPPRPRPPGRLARRPARHALLQAQTPQGGVRAGVLVDGGRPPSDLERRSGRVPGMGMTAPGTTASTHTNLTLMGHPSPASPQASPVALAALVLGVAAGPAWANP